MANDKEKQTDKDKDKKMDKKKLDQLKKEHDKRTGIPYENEGASSDPNRSPSGDDRNANVDHHHEDYVEPYTKKTFHNDKKSEKPKGNK